MPTFIKPARVDVIESGTDWGALVLIGAGVVAAAALLAFVVAHIVLLACCAAGAAVVLSSFVAWSRWISSPKRLAALREAERAEIARALANSETYPNLAALPRGWSASAPRALPRPVEYHVHLHGVTAEDLAAIMPREDR